VGLSHDGVRVDRARSPHTRARLDAPPHAAPNAPRARPFARALARERRTARAQDARARDAMSVPVSTGCEVNVAPREYKSGEMQAGLSDGDRARKVAFITGVTGQDGSYLVELLLSKGANGAMDRSTRKSSRIRASRARVGARMDARGGENDGKVYHVETCARGGRETRGGRRREGKIMGIPERRPRLRLSARANGD
jgi:hypothetical protein